MGGTSVLPRPGLKNLWHTCPERHARFSWCAAFAAVPIFVPVNLALCEGYMCVCVCVCVCVYTYIYIYVYIY
jgi:hypothetical protein